MTENDLTEIKEGTEQNRVDKSEKVTLGVDLRGRSAARRERVASTLRSGYAITRKDLIDLLEGEVKNPYMASQEMIAQMRHGAFQRETNTKVGYEEYKGVGMFFDSSLAKEEIDFDSAKAKIDEDLARKKEEKLRK